MIIALSIIGGLLLSYCIFRYCFVPYILYGILMTRKDSLKWRRDKISKDPDINVICEIGNKWRKDNNKFVKEVEIQSFDNLRLVGEYYDFGFDRTVLIVPGRQETLVYCAYYAKPFKESKCNVLIIDTRGHGESEGIYACAGGVEYLDVYEWVSLIKRMERKQKVVLFGTCIGASTCLTSIVEKFNEDIPLIIDSPYKTYKSCFHYHIRIKHIIDLGVSSLHMRVISKHCKRNINKMDPILQISKFNGDLLMISSKNDEYVSIKDDNELFEKAASKNKTLKIFDQGFHSKIRFLNEEEYDKEISSFISRLS